MPPTSSQGEPNGAGKGPAHLAELLEGSEARAYADLFQHAGPGFFAQRFGAAIAVQASALAGVVIANRVVGLGSLVPATPRLLDSIIALYGDAGLSFGIEVAPTAQADMVDCLKLRRLRRAMQGKAMLWRDGEPPPPRYEKWAHAAGLRVERVGPEWALPLARLSCENFQVPEATMALLVAGTSGFRWRRWVAFDGNQPVGGSFSYVEGEVGWLGWTSVLPSHRGRWVHLGIVARQLEDMAAVGCRWVTTETAPSTADRPDAAYYNLRQFGFREAYVRHTYLRNAPPTSVSTGDTTT